MHTVDFEHVHRTRRGREIPCTWCSQLIAKGEKYSTWGQVHEGQMGRLNMHLECEDAYYKSRYVDDFMPGDFDRGEVWA